MPDFYSILMSDADSMKYMLSDKIQDIQIWISNNQKIFLNWGKIHRT